MTRGVGINSTKPPRAIDLNPPSSEFATGYSLSSNEAVPHDGRVHVERPSNMRHVKNGRGRAEMLLLLYRPFIQEWSGHRGVALASQYPDTELMEIR